MAVLAKYNELINTFGPYFAKSYDNRDITAGCTMTYKPLS